MKILLIQPPIQDFYQTRIRTQPIGLAYLAASLMRHGHEVEILDCQTRKKKSIPIPPELSYLRDFYPFKDRSPFKLYSGYYHFGMGWDEIRKEIEDSKADVFGISSSFTPYHGVALEIVRIIKQWDGRKIVVMGGPHISCDPEGVLQSSLVDYVVLGEGEIRFPFLLERIEEGNIRGIQEIDGVGYRVNREVRINPLKTFVEDLDSLPHPSRELLDLDRYRIRKKRSTMIITSRGCPHGCAYCSTRLVMGASFRMRSPETILLEMVECREKYGIEIFDIEDDNFTFDQERTKRLMSLIIKTFGEGNLQLSAMNGVSFASLDGELLELMKKAGFKAVNLSFVSTDTSTTKRLGRPREGTGFEEILEGAERVGLQVIAYAILGMPGQTIEEMVDTLIYLMGKRVLIGPSIYYPTPGTPLFNKCKKEGVLPFHQSQWRSSAFPIETQDFSRLDIATLFRLVRTINFIKEKMDIKGLSDGMTWKGLFQMLKEKAEGENEAEDDTPCLSSKRFLKEDSRRVGPCDEDTAFTWFDLLLLLNNERSFFSLRKDPAGRLSIFEERSSKRVLDCFFERAWRSPLLKTR
jgi:anaerobic magnesium-protoporphyrin IX monomethyl ester cyclase